MARDAGVPEDPRTSISRETEAVRNSVPQVRRFSSVPRAVFNRLAPPDPRWADLSGLLSLARSTETYPPLWGLDSACRLAPGYGAAAKSPGDARLAHRDQAASAATPRVCVLHPGAATAPRLRTQDASRIHPR